MLNEHAVYVEMTREDLQQIVIFAVKTGDCCNKDALNLEKEVCIICNVKLKSFIVNGIKVRVYSL